jgi:hypothetical protein
MKRSRSGSTAMLSVVLISLLLVSCADETPTDPIVVPDCDNLPALLAGANDALAAKLYEHLQWDAVHPQEPDDVNFAAARGLYQDAYDCSKSNQEARFGLAICDLLSLSANAEVNAAFDEWQAYLELNTPFEAPAKSGDRPLVSLLGLPSGAGALKLPFDVVRQAAVANMKAFAGGDPLVATVQHVLRDIVLPRVEASNALLAPVGDDAAFRYEVSGRMQGDPEEMEREIDQADVLALRAALNLLAAGIKVAVAYDVQFTSYDDDGMLAGLNQSTGNIMTLVAGGVAMMQGVPVDVLAAAGDLDAAITSLEGETDNQDNDVIKIGPDGASQADLDEIQNQHLGDLREAFAAGGLYYTENWDFDEGTPDTALRVDLYAFFNSPIQDWKQILPPYTVVIETVPGDDGNWNYNQDTVGPVSVAVPAGYSEYSRQYRVRYDNSVRTSADSWGTFPAFDAACETAIASRLLELEADLTWNGSASISVFHYGRLAGGMINELLLNIYISYAQGGTRIYAPRVTWDAATYTAWCNQMPDPTLSGLFPELDSGQEFVATFGFSESSWEPAFTWNWYQMDTTTKAMSRPVK